MRGTAFILIVLAACGPQVQAPLPPVVEAPRDAVRLAAVSPVAIAAEGSTVYYADLEGVWALDVAGGDARLVAAPKKMVERIVPYGDELVLGTAEGLLAVPVAGGPVRELHRGPIGPIAVDADGVWFLDGNDVLAVPLSGAAPARVVADGLTQWAGTIAVDGDAVYAAIVDQDAPLLPMADAVEASAIWRVAKKDGARTKLAARQYGVTGLLRRDDRLYWSSQGAGLRSIPARGGKIRTDLGGGGRALAADAAGIIVQTETNMFVEVRAEGSHLAPGTSERWPEVTPPFVLAGGAMVALFYGESFENAELWREPRPWGSKVTVAGWVTDKARELVATGDGVLVLDAPLDEAATGRILRIDGKGRRSVLASGVGMSGLAVDGDTIAYRAGDAIWRKDGASAPVRAVTLPPDELVLGLALGSDSIYWSDGDSIRTAPRKGGPPVTLHKPTDGWGGTGRPSAQLVIDGKAVYYNTLGHGGYGVRRVTGDETSDSLYDPTEEDGYAGSALVRAGDALYMSVSTGTIMRVPLDGGGARPFAKDPSQGPGPLAVAGDRLLTVARENDLPAIALVEAGKLTTVVALPREPYVELAGVPGDDAVYATLYETDLIVRVPLPPAR